MKSKTIVRLACGLALISALSACGDETPPAQPPAGGSAAPAACASMHCAPAP